MNRDKTRKHKIVLLIVLGIFFSLLAYIYPPVFETNDDRTMRQIISGMYGDEYSAYSIFMGYPLSFVLSKLYILIPNVSWYGLFFCACIIVSLWIVLSSILIDLKKEKDIRTWKSVLIAIVILIIYINCFIVQQFTVIAAILSGTAIFKYLKRDSYIGIGILCFLAYEVRKDVFLMAIPFFLIVALWNDYGNKKNVKGLLKGILPIMTVVIGITIVGMGADKVAYSSDSWKEYQEYNSVRSDLYDNYYFWGNKEYEKKCKQSGISDRDYYVTNTYSLLLDSDVTTEKISLIRNAVAENKRDNFIIKSVKVIYYLIRNCFINYWKYTLFMIFLDIILLIGLRRESKRKVILWLLSIVGKYLIISYLVWMARLPERVFLSIFLIVLLLDIPILFETINKSNHKIKNYCIWVILGASLLMLISRIGFYSNIRTANCDYNEVNKYCLSHSDRTYVLAIDELCNSSSDVLCNSNEKTVYLEPWLTNSPLINNYLKKYECRDFGELLLKKSIYYVVHKDYNITNMINYMEHRFGNISCERVDKINENYYVYKFTIQNNGKNTISKEEN